MLQIDAPHRIFLATPLPRPTGQLSYCCINCLSFVMVESCNMFEVVAHHMTDDIVMVFVVSVSS